MKQIILLFSLLTIVSNPKTIGYVDIKGNVNNPGVYKIYEDENIQDIINKAGGLKKNSYTDNINLSKLVKDEMVIYVYSINEIKKITNLNKCICKPIYKYKECDKDDVNNNMISSIITTTVPITTPITSSTIPNKITEITTQKSTTSTTITSTTTTIKTNETTTVINENRKININTCTIDELIMLKGLGESRAKKIIEYRNSNGKFNTIEDLLKVNGIGNKIFENIAEFIEV